MTISTVNIMANSRFAVCRASFLADESRKSGSIITTVFKQMQHMMKVSKNFVNTMPWQKFPKAFPGKKIWIIFS